MQYIPGSWSRVFESVEIMAWKILHPSHIIGFTHIWGRGRYCHYKKAAFQYPQIKLVPVVQLFLHFFLFYFIFSIDYHMVLWHYNYTSKDNTGLACGRNATPI